MAGARRAASRLRLLVTAIALLAMAVQVFGVQSHVHPLHAAAQGASMHSPAVGAAARHAAGAPHRTAPADDDAARCSFCQQLGHSQQLVACTLVLVAFCVFITVGFVPADKCAPVLLAVRHAWQSRAPPRR